MKKIIWIILIGICFTACKQTVADVEKAQANSLETIDKIEDEFANAEQYRFDHRNEKDKSIIQVNSLAINYLENNKFSFQIITGTKSGCTGEIVGTATIKNGIAKYSDENCQSLLFKFSKSKITVEETDCDWSGNYHGAGCSFSGEYSQYP